MDKGVRKSYFYNPAEKEKSSSSNDGNSSKGNAGNTPQNKKEVNSWDQSTNSSNREIPKVKTNDWDSSSECQETMVEPFDDNDNQGDWDSESEKKEPGGKGAQSGFAGSVDSFDLSIGNLSDIVKSSESENGIGIEKTHREDSLLVEDFEEVVRDDTDRKSAKTDVSREFSEKVRSNESEGTPEDTTIWMIPNSERTQSRGSTSKLISSADREKIDKLGKITHFIKKTKSLSEVQKIKTRRRSARYARSEYSGSQKNNYNSFLLYEGSDLRRKLEIESEKTKANISGFDRTRVFFTEYECRTMTMSEDTPQKWSPESRTVLNVPNDDPESPNETNANESEVSINETERAGPSSMDVVSLPDMIGRKSFKKRKQETGLREKERSGLEKLKTRSWGETQASESWLLLDDTGLYQTIPRNVVSILLNGKSADAVLQGRKQHFIRNITLKDTASLRNSLSSMLEEENLMHVTKEDDLGGEDDRKRIVDLERKVENTLFYIQSGMNNTASVRIIPLDTDMIHLWRRTIDGGSALSLELDQMNSQDSVDAANQRNPIDLHSGITRRPFVEETVSEEDEIQPADSTTVNRQMDPVFSGFHENQVAEYAKLLSETRMIVESLTNNFKVLQNRLDGETHQSKALQGEVKKLRVLLKNCGGKFPDRNSRENVSDEQSVQSNPTSSPSRFIPKEDPELKSESMMDGTFADICSKLTLGVQDESTSMEGVIEEEQEKTRVETNITVNIYTMESFTPALNCKINPDNFSIAQSNLKMIEQQMKSLKDEHDFVLKQNVELKRKLREISLELEKYLADTSGEDTCVEEGRELETLRDQVCNLKLELENLKKWVRVQKKQFTEEKSLIEEESRKSIFSIKHWCATAGEILKKIETTNGKLLQNDIVLDANPEPGVQDDPENFSNFLLRHIEETARCMLKLKSENFLLEQTAREDLRKESKETSNLDQVISGYTELIEQCRKGQITGETESKVMEDYFAVIMEKASLMEEIKILKTENEMLLEGQLEHYEKLKQTMIALKDRKSEVNALESSQKLLEEERTRMTEVLKLCEEEKKTMEVEIMEKSKTIQDLVEEMKRKDLEMADCNDRLNAAVGEINNLEKSCRLKDELINELRREHDDLLNTDGIKDDQIEILRKEITNLQVQGTHLEAELTSSKLFLNESRKEMTDYISHLEALVNSSQESLEKVKQKLKESNQTINRLKSENDVLDKQHQCDVKLFNNTKDELDYCKEKLVKVDRKLKESEEEREKLSAKCESLAGSEKEKSEALEVLTREYKAILGKNADLVEKVQMFSKDKDESLKDQKDLINKYAMLSKEIQKLQDKYRIVKSECNERTDLIKYLEMMLRENLVEYNSRIAGLEQSISRIIEKIVACKDGMKEKHFGVDSEVRELRRQLDVTHRERKEIESVVNNYYSLTKHLEREIQDREKKVEELHARLSLEQRKTAECGNERKPFPEPPDRFRIEQLERQIAETDGELTDCRKELQRCQTAYENEKKKLELTITDLKSEVKRYQLRIEVMMKNISNCNRNTSSLNIDKRITDDSEIQSMRKELQEKEKTITELKDTINKYKVEVKLKDSDLENSNKRGFYQGEELKNLQSQIEKMQDAMSTANKTTAVQQKERDEMAEKLFQSIKLIMEERSARQTIETLAVENEKNLRNQIDHVKDELMQKVKECEALSGALEEKKKLVSKLQDDLKKMKAEVSLLKGQVNNYKRNSEVGEEQLPNTSISLPHLKPHIVSSERLESCLRELKEIRDVNLQLRKTEGQYQAKIVRLEDEIRDARLLIKELQGDIKTEKKSKKAFKNMITAAKMEIEKCVLGKQLMSVIAERISRHLDLSEIPSREFLSGFRISDSSSSSKYVPE